MCISIVRSVYHRLLNAEAPIWSREINVVFVMYNAMGKFYFEVLRCFIFTIILTMHHLLSVLVTGSVVIEILRKICTSKYYRPLQSIKPTVVNKRRSNITHLTHVKAPVVVVWLRDGFYVDSKLIWRWERRSFKPPTSTFFVGRGNSHWRNYWRMKCASNFHHLLFASDAICKVFRNSSVKNWLVTHSLKRFRFG